MIIYRFLEKNTGNVKNLCKGLFFDRSLGQVVVFYKDIRYYPVWESYKGQNAAMFAEYELEPDALPQVLCRKEIIGDIRLLETPYEVILEAGGDDKDSALQIDFYPKRIYFTKEAENYRESFARLQEFGMKFGVTLCKINKSEIPAASVCLDQLYCCKNKSVWERRKVRNSIDEVLDFSKCESSLGIRFHDIEWLKKALNETKIDDSSKGKNRKNHANDTLAVVGDALLSACLALWLTEKNNVDCKIEKDELTDIKKVFVNDMYLAFVAKRLNLDAFLHDNANRTASDAAAYEALPNGEKALSTAFEAVVAAVYYDQGFENTLNWIKNIPYFSYDKIQARMKDMIVVISSEDKDKCEKLMRIINTISW